MIFHNELDRLNPKDWYARKFRGGITQKVAVELGYTELKRRDTFIKGMIFSLFYTMQPLLLKIFVTKNTTFDKISFWIFDKLVGANLFKGYNSK